MDADPQGSELAEAFVRRMHAEHGSALYGWALSRLGDAQDAEEVVADTLARAWRYYDQFDPARGTERSWVFAIARNAATDRHRRRGRHLRLLAGVPTEEAVHDAGIESYAESTVVKEALHNLPEHHRAVVIEAYFEGRSVNQIASRLGIPGGTVKSRLYYALRALRTALEEEGILG